MILLLLLALSKIATSCSHVCIDAKHNVTTFTKEAEETMQFCARTMEQLTPFDYLVEGTPKGEVFPADFPLCANHDGKGGWTGDHSFVSVNIDVGPCEGSKGGAYDQLCADYLEWQGKKTTWAADGINEHGLAVSMLAFMQRRFTSQDYDPKKLDEGYTYVCYMDFVAYALSKFKTIKEMEDVMTKEDGNGEPMFIMLDTKAQEKFEKFGETTHWSIQDATGRNVVLEYNVHNPGKATFYENTAGILTNNPDFMWHMTNLNNYVNMGFEEGGVIKNEHGTEWKKVFGAEDLTHKDHKGGSDRIGNKLGVGTNFMGIPGDFSPPSRFVRLYYLKQLAVHQLTPTIEDCGKDCPDFAVPFVENIIASVTIPRGTIPMEVAPLVSQTQWTVIKVPKQRKFYWKGSTDHRLKMIDLSRLTKADYKRDFAFIIEDWKTHAMDKTEEFSIIKDSECAV